MQSDGLTRHLYVKNRLEELRKKYGHESDWPECQPLQCEATGVGTSVNCATEKVPLPSRQSLTGGGVTPTADPGTTPVVDQLDL
jgi:hypothetical protein